MRKLELKRTLIKVLKFVIIFLVIDFLFGTLANTFFLTQETGKFARSTYVIKKANEAILIFGSSHAHRHYVPEVIVKQLNKTCYNAGADGQQLVYHSALQKMVFKRTKPELIILNIDEEFLFKSNKSFDRMSDLNPYYSEYKNEMDTVLKLKSKYTDPKLLLKSYQNNSTIVQALKYYLAPQKTLSGYRPLYEKMTEQKLKTQKDELVTKDYIEEMDSINIKVLKDFITQAKKKNVTLIFITSPNLIKTDVSQNESFNTIVNIAQSEKIPFYNFMNSTTYLNKLDLFYDASHLNDLGARLFTEEVVQLLKNNNHIP